MLLSADALLQASWPLDGTSLFAYDLIASQPLLGSPSTASALARCLPIHHIPSFDTLRFSV